MPHAFVALVTRKLKSWKSFGKVSRRYVPRYRRQWHGLFPLDCRRALVGILQHHCSHVLRIENAIFSRKYIPQTFKETSAFKHYQLVRTVDKSCCTAVASYSRQIMLHGSCLIQSTNHVTRQSATKERSYIVEAPLQIAWCVKFDFTKIYTTTSLVNRWSDSGRTVDHGSFDVFHHYANFAATVLSVTTHNQL